MNKNMFFGAGDIMLVMVMAYLISCCQGSRCTCSRRTCNPPRSCRNHSLTIVMMIAMMIQSKYNHTGCFLHWASP